MENNEQKAKYLEDITRYQYADVAGRFFQNKEDSQFIPSALEKMVSGWNVDKDLIDGFRQGAMASQDGVAVATQIYAKKYKSALNSLSVPEFYDLRAGILKSLFGNEKTEEYKSFFEEYKDLTVGSIEKKMKQAQAIISDDTGLFDEEKKKSAKKTFEKYQKIASVIGLLENRNFEEIRAGATKVGYTEMIKHLIEGKEEKE